MARGIGARFMTLGGGEVVARLAAFAATVYLARTLPPALYGIIGVAMGVMLYLVQLADGGVELVGVPHVARARDRVADIAAPVLAVRTVFATALTALVVLTGVTILPQPDGAILAIYSLALVAAGLSTRWVHLGLERAGGVALSRTVGELVALGVIVAFVDGAGDIAVVPLAHFAGAGVTSLLLLVALRRSGIELAWRWDPAAARPVFVRARPIVGFTLLGLLLFNFDLIYLRVRTGAAAAGYYAAAYTMIAFAANLIVAFAHTVLPTLTRLEGEPGRRDALYRQACAQALALALPIGAGAWFVSEQVIRQIFGAAYLPGVVALQWLAWTIPLAALRELPVIALIAAGAERQLLRVNALTVVANVVLVVATVPRYGLAGAAAATVATELVRLTLATHHAHRAGYPLLPVARALKAAAATAFMATVLVLMAPGALWTSVPVGAVAYGVGLLLVRGIRFEGRVPALSV